MANILIIGASEQGECSLDIIERTGSDRVAGFLDDNRSPGETIGSAPILGAVADAARLRSEGAFDLAVVTIGDNHTRRAVARRLRDQDPDIRFATLIDPSATIAGNVELGEGTVVMAGAVVNRGARVGAHALLCVRASLDHHSTMGTAASLAPGAVTGGQVRIGDETAIGMGAVVIHARSIGAHAVVGAGATVVSDVDDHAVVMGTPARVVRTRAEGEPYL